MASTVQTKPKQQLSSTKVPKQRALPSLTRSRHHHWKSAFRPTQALAGSLSWVSEMLKATMTTQQPGIGLGTATNTAVFIVGYRVLSSGLTSTAIVSAWLLGSLSFAAFGVRGYSIACAYFIVGTAVTKLRISEKEGAGIAEKNKGKRPSSSVYGSSSAAIVASAVSLLLSYNGDPQSLMPACAAAYVASFAAKLADTVSSEIGKAFGEITILPTTLERVMPGTEGAISVEGSLSGIAAGFAMCASAYATGFITARAAVISFIAVIVSNAAESYLGASAQGKAGWLTNDIVNILLIFFAASLASIGVVVLH